MGFDPLRSAWEDTVYRHCVRAINLVLDRRMGAHGLPLIGTGDWNDGLDEIGSQGKGESVWLGFFLSYILERMVALVERKEGPARSDHYRRRLYGLQGALEGTWRDDRYLRAIHDDGMEIGVKGSGVWEIDALTARGQSWGASTRGAVSPKEIVIRLAATGVREAEIAVPLPATPGLTNVREVVLTHEQKAAQIDLSLTQCGFTPIGPAPRRPER
jgi:hypothetical protein